MGVRGVIPARKIWVCLFLWLFSSLLIPPCGSSGQEAGRAILENRCSGCHAPREQAGKLDVIEFQRKTPEGWEMTIARMIRTQEVSLQPGEGRILVKYLSDHYGLAPSEVEPFRYALERRNNTVEQEVPEALQKVCVQCHSFARIALQRRTPDQWYRLADLKAALMPNIESQTASAGLLHDVWYTAVQQETAPYLANTYPFASEAWATWQAAPTPDYAGSWKVVGHDPGTGGDYTGRMMIKALGDGQYAGEFTHEFADGSRVSGKTTAIVYTGFQWRGTARPEGGTTQKEIFFASEDGSVISGRRLLTEIGDLGRDETLYKDTGAARLLTIIPSALKTGEKQTLKIFGMNFPSDLTANAVTLGTGIKVQSLSLNGNDTIVAEVMVEQEAQVAPRQVKILGVQGEMPLYVYRTIDSIRVSPQQAFSRPGGIHAPKILQQFEVFGYLNGKDGRRDTQDDVKLGRVSPISWSLAECVKRMNDDDVRFVGTLNENGLFTPATDGPNPQRHMSEHNVGDVWVEAWYQPDGAKRPMGARAFLLVMPERFNFQPIE